MANKNRKVLKKLHSYSFKRQSCYFDLAVTNGCLYVCIRFIYPQKITFF